MGENGDTLIIVIVIALSVILMFIFPLMTMGDRADDITQATVEAATREFVDNVCTKGKITPDDLTTFRQKINSTGYLYDVEIQVKVLDENPGKKSVQVNRDKIGENLYYTVETSQITDIVEPETGTPKPYLLKEGDLIYVNVRSASQGIARQLKNFFYTVIGDDTYDIAASESGMSRTTGTDD